MNTTALTPFQPNLEWANAIWYFVTGIDRREKEAERRHQELLKALGNLTEAVRRTSR